METIHKSFDKRARVLYVSVGKPRPATSRHLSNGVLVRVDPQTGEFVGLTVFGFNATKEKKYENTIRGAVTIPKGLLPQIINKLKSTASRIRK